MDDRFPTDGFGLAAASAAARDAVVIFNPTAGARRERRLAAVLARLEAAGMSCRVAGTAARGDAERLAREAGDDDTPPGLVIAAGGDGTINEVVNGLMASASPPPLAILPLGTANVLAAEIGLPVSSDAVAAAILGGRRLDISVARVNGRCFLLMAGVGFDAHVVAGVDSAVKRRLGKGAYVLESARQMWRFGFPRYRVTIDGASHEAASVVVARSRFYGGRHLAAPEARLDSDSFQVCLFERGGRGAVLRYGLALVTGRLPGCAGYCIRTGRRVTIEGPVGDPVQADGDVVAHLPAEIDLAPRRLSLIVPRLVLP